MLGYAMGAQGRGAGAGARARARGPSRPSSGLPPARPGWRVLSCVSQTLGELFMEVMFLTRI